MSRSPTADVVVAGGGVIGCAVAYFLTASPDFGGRVLVVERDTSYQFGSTARSAGSIRQQFSTPINIRMSQFGLAFIRRAEELLTVDGCPPALAFREAGYLFLATERGREALARNHAVQRECGADVALLDAGALAARFPWLAVADLAGGSLGLSGEGWFDPYALLQALRSKARSAGAQFVHDEVTGVEWRGRRIEGVRLRSGERLGCAWLVNATGPRAAELATMAGVHLPVRPRKRFVFVFDCREPPPACPLVIDPSGAYFRPEGPHFICGISPAPAADPDCLDFDIDYSVFEEQLRPLLAARVPAFSAIKLVNAWAGHYAYNVVDQNAILGLHPDRDNLLLANGFSGHGLQHAPAVGRGLAELVTYGAYRALDLSLLSYARIVEARPLRERNAV